MKHSSTKQPKLAFNTPTTNKQSPLKSSGAVNYAKLIKQSSRYNTTKLVQAKPDSNLNSPIPILQKAGFSVQTPSQSSSKMLYLKQKYCNPTSETFLRELNPHLTKPQLDKFIAEKSLEINTSANSYSSALGLTTATTINASANYKHISVNLRDHSADSHQPMISESVGKRSPSSSSSQHQTKLLGMLRKDNKPINAARLLQVSSPHTDHGKFKGSAAQSNKENVNTLNSLTNFASESKHLSKRTSRRRPLNTSASNANETNNIMNESSETLRIGNHPNQASVDKEGGERCANHPHKKAKYFVIPPGETEDSNPQENPENRYCSKCAIRLAGQGSKIQEFINSPEEQRKSEIEEFLLRLSQARRDTNATFESIIKKKEDVKTFYSKQMEKAELIVSAIVKIINAEKTRAMEELALSQEQTLEDVEDMERQVEEKLGNINAINNDIEKNLDNILHNIESKPFKVILAKYNEKLAEFTSFMDEQIKPRQINVSKLPGFKRKALDDFKPLLLTFFNRIAVSTSLVKRGASPDQPMAEIPAHEGASKVNLSKSSLYISFENKEIFENAINSCREGSMLPAQPQLNTARRCSDLYSYTYAQKVPQLPTDSDFSPRSVDTNRTYNTLREESKSIVKKGDIDLEGFMTNRTARTPQGMKRTQQTSNSLSTKRPMSYQIFSDNKLFGTNPSTSDFESHQMSLQQTSMNEQSTQRDFITDNHTNTSVNSMSNFQSHNRHESCPSPQLTGLEMPYTTEASETSSFALQGSRSTKKYINILEKISSNQSRKNAIYSNMIKSNAMISPRYSTARDESTDELGLSASRLKTDENEIREAEGLDKLPEKMTPDNGLSGLSPRIDSRPDALNSILSPRMDVRTDNNPQKELKNYAPFFHFIENKINTEKQQQQQQSQASYQKTLFCCSPNFKENIQPTEEEEEEETRQ